MAEMLKKFGIDTQDEGSLALWRAMLRFAAAFSLVVLALVLYGPALGDSRFVYGTDTVGHDYPMHLYAWMKSVGTSGQLPLWNPYLFSGLPMIGSAAICPFYPTQWLYWLLPFNLVFTLQYVLAVAIGGMGAGWWMRWLGHRRAVCFWAGILYMVSGHFLTLTHAGHLQKMMALAWTPVALGATLQVMQFGRTGVRHSRRYKAAALLGIALGMQLLASHPQIFYGTAVACVFQLVGMAAISLPWKSIMTGARAPKGNSPVNALRRIGRAIALSALALIICAAVAAVQLFPTLEMSGLSNRAAGVSFAEATETSYPPLEILEYAIPSIFGDSIKGSDLPYLGKWGERIVSDYIGLPVILLALIGLFGNKRRYRWFLLVLFLAGFLIGIGRYTPLYWLLWEVMPGFSSFRSPGTFMFLSNCALVGLSALGLEYLLNLADSVNSRGWGSSFTESVTGEESPFSGDISRKRRQEAYSSDETQPFDVTALAATAPDTPPYGYQAQATTDTPPQNPALEDPYDYDQMESDPGLYYGNPDDSQSQVASSNFAWDNDNTPWLGRPVMLIFLAVGALFALAAAIIALAENWDVNLNIATRDERLSYHTYSRVAGAAIAIMGLLGGLLLLRLRTWIGGLVIGVVALAFPLFYNYKYLSFEPLPPYMAHLTRQPDLQALAKQASQPVRLLEQNALKNEDMLYGISSVAGYHPIVPAAYAEMSAALGFTSFQFGDLFAVNHARGEMPAGEGWVASSTIPQGNGGTYIFDRATPAPYVRENPVLETVDTSSISLTSATANAIIDAVQFGRAGGYTARVSEDDARRYRLVAGPQAVTGTLVKWLPHQVRLRVSASPARAGAGVLLPVSDPYFPGWYAETSAGRRLPVVAVNGVQRGVILPPGEHNIRFVYAPYAYRLGLFVSLFSATLLLFYASGTALRRVTRSQKKLRKAIKKTQTGAHPVVHDAFPKDNPA